MSVSKLHRRFINNTAITASDRQLGRVLQSMLNHTQLTVIAPSSTTTTRVLKAEETGATCLFDRAAGLVYTLPAPELGLYFDFDIRTTITSNSATVNAGATRFITGALLSIDTDTANAAVGFVANGTSHISIAMNGTTTGGVAGTKFRVECISTTASTRVWMVSGNVLGSGVVATPFA